MAIITEQEHPNPTSDKPTPRKPHPKPQARNPFFFWLYFLITVSLTTIISVSFNSLSSPQDPKSWFLSLPQSLRQHYSSGRIIKVQINPNQPPIEVFSAESGLVTSEKVLILHGLGLSSYAFRDTIRSLGSKGVHAVAIDLPGHGFSDKSTTVVDEEKAVGVFGRFKEVYSLIQEKGIFWAFDQMVETGQIPYEEVMKLHASNRKSVKPLELGSEEIGKAIGEVVKIKKLAPLHIVLHDSALRLASNWVYENSKLIKSITLLDTGANSALPLCTLDIPILREITLGFGFAFRYVVGSCCSKKSGSPEIDANLILLKGKNGRSAVVGTAKKMNSSFDVAEWGSFEGIKEMPMQLIWSADSSKEWSQEGGLLAGALHQAKFFTHSGGRWPQEDTADELSDKISEFVSSLPKSVRQVEEEAIPEHVQKILDDTNSGDNHNDHDHHATGHMDAYGVGHGWAS